MPPPKKRAPVHGADARRERAAGALLGLAVGDALGATLEFKQLLAPDFPKLADGPHREISGGGPFSILPGQVTDDTQMATALANGLRACRGFDAAEVSRRYRAWLPHAFDAGTQTRAALEGSAKAYWLAQGRRPAGNGSLMRAAPIGVWYARDRPARIRASLEDSALTHFDPRCGLACAALNGAIAQAITAMEAPSADDLLRAASSDLGVAAAELAKASPELVREVAAASEELRADLARARDADPQLYGPELHLHAHQGYVRVAFRLAFWELAHAPSFEAALVDVVNRGGDSDTNAAICGALIGAAKGEGAIPGRWRDAVMRAAPASRVLREELHPVQLMRLLEAIDWGEPVRGR